MLAARFIRLLIGGLACVVLLPNPSWAQAGAIAGLVRDTSGGVLPGVTVEATSPALIEKVRTVVTDAQGQYKLLDLSSGVFTVTFSLQGFSTVRREGIQVRAGEAVNLNVELPVGSVEETITVSGQAPVVDIQNVTQHRVITEDLIQALPTGRGVAAFAMLIPGMTASSTTNVNPGQDVGGTVGERRLSAAIHGSRTNEFSQLFNGMKFNNLQSQGAGGVTIWQPNVGMVQEVVVDVGGHSAETSNSGPMVNSILKDGGNSFKGDVFANYTNHNLTASNISSEQQHIGSGVSSTQAIDKLWEATFTLGGPVKRDRLWFVGSARKSITSEFVPGAYYAKNPLAYVYQPDLTRPALNDTHFGWVDLRLTWQPTPRNKVALFGDNHWECSCHGNVSSIVTPEAANSQNMIPSYAIHATYTSPVTNKLLVDIGAAATVGAVLQERQPGTDETTYSVSDLFTGKTYRAVTNYARRFMPRYYYRAKVSYVTGSHVFNVGVQPSVGYRREHKEVNQDATLQLFNGEPRQVTVFNTPTDQLDKVNMELGVFAEDQWTFKRLTTHVGARFDYLNATAGSVNLPAARYRGPLTFPAIPDVPNWKDISPRLGVSYDLFGNGRTAIKGSVGKYLQANGLALATAVNPITTSVSSTTRPWQDPNGDFIPQDFELGPLANPNFGKQVVTTAFDPDYLRGWGKRGLAWEGQAGIQQEMSSGVSISATYTRHWLGNFLVNKNLLTTPSDYSSFCVTAPKDSRLPQGGGNQICGFMDVNPEKFGKISNLITFAAPYGRVSDVYSGVDVTINARLPHGAVFQGGTSTGREVTDNCSVAGKVNNPAGATLGTADAPANPSNIAGPSALYCHIAPPVQTHLKLLGVFPLPWWGLRTSATFQSVPGPQITASQTVTNDQIASSLGRNLSGGATVTTVQLISPGALYGDRLNQVDFRLEKTFRVSRTQIHGLLDLYNLLNANPVLAQNNTYGNAWLTPTYILPGRFLKFGTEITF